MKYFKIASFCLLISACKTEKEKQLVGKWEATKLVECEADVPFQTELVNIEFLPNGKYVFNSTLNVHEEGDFHLEDDYLIMQDRIKAGSSQKVVLIKDITTDTLILEMNYKGKEQFLTLTKDVKKPVLAQNISLKDSSKAVISTSNSESLPIASSNTEGTTKTVVSMPSSSNGVDNTEVKKATEIKPSVEIKKEEVVSEAEAYRRREAKRREEIADREREEKDKRAAYLEREAARQKAEIARKRKALEAEKERDKAIREAYMKREAQRKKEAAARKKS
jgi:hypothetical protein